MSVHITLTARRIARTVNQYRGRGGKLVFDEQGRGGEWVSENAWPEAPIVYAVPSRPHTPLDVQKWLDRRAT